MENEIHLVINGEQRIFPSGITLAGVIRDLQLDPSRIIVEHNRKIVAKDALARTFPEHLDKIELIRVVGGG